MLNRLNEETVELLIRMDIPTTEDIQSTNQDVTEQSNYDKAQATSASTSQGNIPGREGYDEAIHNSGQQVVKQQPVVAEKKIGRNDPCHCGSGKKYKQCHGKIG